MANILGVSLEASALLLKLLQRAVLGDVSSAELPMKELCGGLLAIVNSIQVSIIALLLASLIPLTNLHTGQDRREGWLY